MNSSARQHFPALDGLRAVAVLMVLLTHTMSNLFAWGWLGVQVFFVLSGFLITGILFDSRDRPTRYRDFYIRRALRIFPLYYAVLLAVLALSIWGSHPRHFWLWFLYLQNWAWYLPNMRGFSDVLTFRKHYIGAVGHLWSLAVEEQFYLLWPFLVFRFRSRQGLVWLCCAGIVFRLILGCALQHWAPQPWLQLGLIYRLLPTQLDGFLMGALLSLWIRKPGERARKQVRRLGALAPLALGAYVLLLFVLRRSGTLASGGVLSYSSPFQALLGIPLANAVSVLVIAAALVPGTAIYEFCSLSWLRRLGLISYGFYIFHLCVFAAIVTFLHDHMSGWPFFRTGIWDAVTVFLLTTVISYASYRWLESPFLRLKDRFAPSHRSTPSGREVELVS